MKILMIGFFGRTYMPYIEHYETVLNEEGISYDVCFFNRKSNDALQVVETPHGHEYIFSGITTAGSLSKLLPGIGYISFLKRLIKREKYDKIIVFTTMPAVLLGGVLRKRYPKRYIFDYRDFTYENHPWFASRVEKIIENAAFTSFSSEGFLESFAIDDNYLVTHNISNLESVLHGAADLKSKETISIGFLGSVRYYDRNVRLIDAFAGDDKYILKYFGARFTDCDLESYCRKNHIQNVEFFGEFDNKEKPRLYEQVDLINSLYSLDSPDVRQAIPNRLYDAAMYKKPIIVSEGTQLAKEVKKYGLGIELDPLRDDMRQKIQAYIDAFDPVVFEENCDDFLSMVYKDMKYHAEKIRTFCTSK